MTLLTFSVEDYILELFETRARVYIKKERKNTRLVLYSLSITSLPMAALSLLLES